MSSATYNLDDDAAIYVSQTVRFTKLRVERVARIKRDEIISC